jgi:Tol biopolymer transport system component
MSIVGPPRRPIEAVARLLTLLSVLLVVGIDCSAATRYDWRLRFSTIHTAHFDIHAHQGEEALARRLAGIVEDVRASLEMTLGLPRSRVQVILVDQTDLSNGWANPFPYDTIEITALPPTADTLIGNSDDWLRLAFSHEYTHILHLDRSRGVMNGLRRVFGRAPFVFPNLFLPVWQIEGIATFEESQVTHEGRVPAGDFRVIVDEAARRRRFDPQDRAAGGLVAWPSGLAAYAYGAYFHQYLADTYGAEQLARLADATAGRVPFFGAPAFETVFGRSVGDLWNDFRDSRSEATTRTSQTDRLAHRLTHQGFNVSAPRFGPDGVLYYALADAHRFPSLQALTPDGRTRTVATRVEGDRTTVHGRWVVFDQVERVRSTALYSDLYAFSTDTGRTRRLTVEARASDPDFSPDGRRLACVVHTNGRSALAIVDFRPDERVRPSPMLDEPDTDFSGPRWSPDGQQIVVERRRRRGPYELVVVDVASRQVRSLVARTGVRVVNPTWTADSRWVLFAANVGDEPFNVYAVSVADGSVQRVTDSVTGASAPEVSPDGRSLVYVGYTVDGYDLFTIPFEPSSWRRMSWPADNVEAPVSPTTNEAIEAYRPWRSLLPTYWSPLLATDAGELLVGAGTAMSDVLGRHSYAVDAAWSGARARPDWHASYAYDRWWPTLFASYSDDTDPTSRGDSRARELLTGAVLPIRRLRWTETGLAALDFEADTFDCVSLCSGVRAHRKLGSLRAGWIHDSRRQFGYSISAEEGIQIEAAIDSSRTALGADTDATATVVDLRGFQRVIGRHTVVAGRVAFAGAWGNPDGRRLFSAAGPGPAIE